MSEVLDLAKKAGLDPEYVANFLAAYERASRYQRSTTRGSKSPSATPEASDPFENFPGKVPIQKYRVTPLIPLLDFRKGAWNVFRGTIQWLRKPETLDLIFDLIPVIGSGKALYEVYTGEKVFSKRKLEGWERLLSGVTFAAPIAGRAVIKGVRAAKGAKAAKHAATWGRMASGVSATSSAAQFAIVAVERGISPVMMLLFIGQVTAISPRHTRAILARIRAGARSHKGTLNRAEIEAVGDNVAKAYHPLIKPQERPATKSSGSGNTATASPRALSSSVRQQMRAAGEGVERYFQKNPLLSTDRETISQVGQLFKKTRGGHREYSKWNKMQVSRRAAAGEMKMIDKFHRRIHPSHNVEEIRLLKPTNKRGDRTPDFELRFSGGGKLFVEVTTVTKKIWFLRDAYSAFRRKIKRGQINRSRPGIIAVVVQQSPKKGTELLSGKNITELERLIQTKYKGGTNPIEELLLIFPNKDGSVISRVGDRRSAFDIAEETYQVPVSP